MELKVNTSIPIQFERSQEEATDNRFVNVKIWICHTNENLNGSFFEKSLLEKMIPSLSNIPILGYLTVDNFDIADFKGHEQRLILDENGISIEYLGHAYGTIPETNNATFEKKVCSDGVEREFLVCTGKLWRKFAEAIDIFNRDTEKGQSMELFPESIEGVFGKDKLFHFSDAMFEGACILGKGIAPAMIGSVIEKFSYSEIGTIFEEYASFASEQNLQSTDSEVAEVTLKNGGTNLDKILELLQKYSVTIEDLIAKDINHEDYIFEELEAKIQATFQAATEPEAATVVEPEATVVEPEATVVDPEPEATPSVNTEFTLTANAHENELRRELAEIETIVEEFWDEVYTSPRFYYRDCKPQDNIAIAWDCKEGYLVGFNYTVVGDKITIDTTNVIRYKIDYIPMDLGGDEAVDDISLDFSSKEKTEFMLTAKEKFLTKQFESEKEVTAKEFAALKEDHSKMSVRLAEIDQELQAKVQAERDEAVQAIFASFPTLTDEEKADVLAKNANFSLEEIDDKLCAILGRKNRVEAVTKFTAKEPEKPNRIQLPDISEKKSTGNPAIDAIFAKHNIQ